jgi:hypothetical protein
MNGWARVPQSAVTTIPLDTAGSFAWLAEPDEWTQRASVALATECGALLIDPVDFAGLDDAVAPLAPIAGVAQLLDRHNRSVDQVADRLGVPVLVPAALAGRGEPLDVPGVQERVILAMPGWNESALWIPERKLLICAEAIGTAPQYLARQSHALGVHPLLRIRPPRGHSPASLPSRSPWVMARRCTAMQRTS